MKVTTIRLNNEQDAAQVCTTVANFDFNIDAVYGRYVIDAKSLMGLFAFGFGKDIDIIAHTEDLSEIEALCQSLARWRRATS